MALKYNGRSILIRKGEKGVDPLVDSILENPDGPDAGFFLKAEEIHQSAIKKKYVEACLIATDDYNVIANLLDMPVQLVSMYAKIYYDLSGMDRLDKIELLEKSRTKDEIAMKTWALHQGIAFIAWRLGKSKQIDVNPIEGLTDLFNTCIFKSKEALFNTNSTTASVESTKWAKLSVEIARILKMWLLDSSGAKRDLELAIREVMPDFGSLDDINVTGAVQLNPEEETRQDGND